MIFTYHNHEIEVDAQDAVLFEMHQWRVLLTGTGCTVVTSIRRDEDDRRRRGNAYLSHKVAERAGLPSGRVVHVDGNGLNNKRSNLIIQGARPVHRVSKVQPVSNPPGLHRHKVGTDRPAQRYELCYGVKDVLGRCAERQVAATAARTEPDGNLWRVALANGEIISPRPWHEIKDAFQFIQSKDEIRSAESSRLSVR